MAEVAFASRASVGLYVVPDIVIRKLQDTGKEGQESAVNGFREIVGERLDLVHERVQTFGNSADIFPVWFIPVELLNAICGSTVSLDIEYENGILDA